MIDEQQTIDEQQAVKEPVAIETERMNGSAGRRRWSVAAALVIAPLSGVALWLWGSDAYHFLTNEQALEDFVVRAGIWGPLALIFFNIVQIVIAPIPGYMVQLGAGYLYGPLWGGVYAVIGMLAGAMVAMWLARTLGRPMARLLVGENRLTRWESVTHSSSAWVWLLLLLGPVGDTPYALAGLSRVSYLTIFLITILIRAPSVFLSTAIGSGAVPLFWSFVVLGVAGVILLIGLRYKQPIAAWYARALHGGVEAPVTISLPIPDATLDE